MMEVREIMKLSRERLDEIRKKSQWNVDNLPENCPIEDDRSILALLSHISTQDTEIEALRAERDELKSKSHIEDFTGGFTQGIINERDQLRAELEKVQADKGSNDADYLKQSAENNRLKRMVEVMKEEHPILYLLTLLLAWRGSIALVKDIELFFKKIIQEKIDRGE